mmetsp:Transcript_60727/g.54709  ORF Transcript_60727/g.54709 Transcript_60727/m.54709 type:complete len:150 (-) Transcript_60727:236-685(-)|eukprot:CAMPEP_0201576632 /NCGR_PEP_ID=MMETSP0190_2-20130828/22558_1 /ASSEMBLY_ACC=CAM_ASM_000263 /TAXON_ID=37353 /ORGANISM="Rosalina sp." /LENGTH=149 /DNA_ID=CAMNT_0048007725 /DNA_START=91 /DNA_END=540 /DNA_ORIENTATION=-
MSWQQYVQAAQGLGFTKVTIINRQNYQTLAYSSQADIATAWKDGDKEVNENQELLDDWKDVKKSSFCFYGKKFNIVLRDNDEGGFLVCMKGKEALIAKQFKTVWIIAYGQTKKKGAKKEEAGTVGFGSAADAFTKICNNVFDSLDEAGI